MFGAAPVDSDIPSANVGKPKVPSHRSVADFDKVSITHGTLWAELVDVMGRLPILSGLFSLSFGVGAMLVVDALDVDIVVSSVAV